MKREQGVLDLVPFLFGVAGREWLPGPVLVQLLAEAGLPAPTARTTLARMRERGGLASERAGRHVRFRLAGATAAAFSRLGAPRPPAADWDGSFHGLLYTVPESARPFRDALRRAATLTGYGHLRAGLMIAAHDGWPVIAPQVGPIPPGARVAPLTLQLAPEDARSAAAEAWDLPGAAAAMREQEEKLRRAPSVTPRADAQGLREYHELVRPVFRTFLWIPTLPTPLLPHDWPRANLESALHAALRHHQPAAKEYLDSLLTPYDPPLPDGE
ncbi:hypothetical protein GCM10009836_39700 [Pseudonocardia ailaonensis]|uniref:PaaX family transcriptional regulator n=1 Tax=Pseudonocardia ailaonensis TaxID=367279 RepID=A0ABN2N6W5_9PSEU